MKDQLAATITVSDTRTDADDDSGRILRSGLETAGFRLLPHRIVKDETPFIAEALGLAVQANASLVVLTGGTGIAPRDVTIEAVEPLFEKKLEGFGETFRRLSWDEVGPRAILSRASAGVVERSIVVALPGSAKAVKLALEKLLLPFLPHALRVVQGETHLH